jgi:hypothetical protein
VSLHGGAQVLSDRAAAGGVLVLSDLYHPSWRVTVDGQPAEIFPVFSVLRGVRVGAGRHAVTFVCRVPGLEP